MNDIEKISPATKEMSLWYFAHLKYVHKPVDGLLNIIKNDGLCLIFPYRCCVLAKALLVGIMLT